MNYHNHVLFVNLLLESFSTQEYAIQALKFIIKYETTKSIELL